MSDLTTRIPSVPAELFNEIYNLTFRASQASRTIDKNYIPSSSLQVSRKIRSHFALPYFNNDCDTPFYISKDIAAQFLGSLAGKHRLSINSIDIIDADIDIDQIPLVVPWDVTVSVDLATRVTGKGFEDVLYMMCSDVCAIKVSREGRIRWMSFTQLLELQNSGWHFQVP